MKKICDMTSFELMKHNIDLVEKLLTQQGYKFNKVHGRARTDYSVSNNTESYNIKILGYRYNEKVTGNYAYARKQSFDIEKFRYLYFVMYIENKANILKIPTDVFKNPATNSPFKNRDYVGLKSLPEYGIEMNKSNLNELLLYKVM